MPFTPRHVGAILIGTALAAGTPGRASPVTSSPSQSATGTIARVDGATHRLTLTIAHREETFLVSDDTHLRKGAEVVVLADLAGWNGVRVKVRYVDEDGIRRAQSVMVSRDRRTTQDLSGSAPAASGITSPKRSAIR